MKKVLLRLLRDNQIKVANNKNNYPGDILTSLDKIFNYDDNHYTAKFNNMESLLGIDSHLMNFQYNNMQIFLDLENPKNKEISDFFYSLLCSFEGFVINYLKGDIIKTLENDYIVKYNELVDFDYNEYLKLVYDETKDSIQKKIITSNTLEANVINIITSSSLNIKDLLNEYDIEEIDNSIILYCKSINKWIDNLFNIIDKFMEQEEILSSDILYKAKTKLLSFKNQATTLEDRVNKINESENSLVLLGELEEEKRASFKLIAENSFDIVQKALAEVEN